MLEIHLFNVMEFCGRGIRTCTLKNLKWCKNTVWSVLTVQLFSVNIFRGLSGYKILYTSWFAFQSWGVFKGYCSFKVKFSKNGKIFYVNSVFEFPTLCSSDGQEPHYESSSTGPVCYSGKPFLGWPPSFQKGIAHNAKCMILNQVQ